MAPAADQEAAHCDLEGTERSIPVVSERACLDLKMAKHRLSYPPFNIHSISPFTAH